MRYHNSRPKKYLCNRTKTVLHIGVKVRVSPTRKRLAFSRPVTLDTIFQLLFIRAARPTLIRSVIADIFISQIEADLAIFPECEQCFVKRVGAIARGVVLGNFRFRINGDKFVHFI